MAAPETSLQDMPAQNRKNNFIFSKREKFSAIMLVLLMQTPIQQMRE
jgi:hypothetical protein